MRRHVTIIALAAVVLAGCATDSGTPTAPPRTQVELRHFQTRSFAVEQGKVVLKAMVNVLQDLGYIVKNADADLGIVTAEKWADVPHTKKEIKRARKKDQPLAQTVVTECTANVTEYGPECRVRLTFQRRVLGPAGALMGVHVIDDAAFYQGFFSKVDKGVFLQKEGV